MAENKLINIGPKRGASIKKRWDPKEWRPEYEAMAALAATGMPHSEIANRFGYTEAWLSSILNSPKGKIVRQLIVNELRSKAAQAITGERVQELQAKAFKRIEVIIEDDDLAKRSPMAIFGASMEILKKTPVFGADRDNLPINNPSSNITTNNQQVNIFAPGIDRDEINKSLQLANKVSEIHSLPLNKEENK